MLDWSYEEMKKDDVEEDSEYYYVLHLGKVVVGNVRLIPLTHIQCGHNHNLVLLPGSSGFVATLNLPVPKDQACHGTIHQDLISAQNQLKESVFSWLIEANQQIKESIEDKKFVPSPPSFPKPQLMSECDDTNLAK